MSAVLDSPEAQQIQREVLRLEDERAEHTRVADRERKRWKHKGKRLEELRAECARLGIKVNIHTQAKGGHSVSTHSTST